MATDTTLPVLDRPAFFPGQRLTAADLEAVQDFEREFRWLHNRSLHGWGIVRGLAVAGKRGDREVTIAEGFALDCLGRELILTIPTSKQIPPVANDGAGNPVMYFLTASYVEDEDVVPQRRDGLCGTNGAVRRSNELRLRWQNPTDVSADIRFRRGLDIVLATVLVRNCQLADDVSLAGRRDALPAERPAVACGLATPDQLTWHLWPASAPIGVSAIVTTSDAAFRAAPKYEARITGARFYSGVEGTFVVDGPATVAAAGVSSFEIRVVLPGGFTAGVATTATIGDREMMLIVAKIISNPNAWILLGAGASVVGLFALFALATVVGAGSLALLAVAAAAVVATGGGVVAAAALSLAVAATAGVLAGAIAAAVTAGLIAAPLLPLIAVVGYPVLAQAAADILTLVARVVRQKYGDRLFVGEKLSLSVDDAIIGAPVTLSYTIVPHDFDWAINDIVSQHQIFDAATFRNWNGMPNDADLSLTYGSQVIVKDDPIMLNPPGVLNANFVPNLNKVLRWGVEWTGVEG